MGPYNPLNEQLKYNPETGEVLEWYNTLHNKVDEISAFHDICYEAELIKVHVIDKWLNHLIQSHMAKCQSGEQTARFIINTKQKLGSKNVNRR